MPFVLTGREEQIVKFIVGGLSNKQIAHEMGVTESTVKNHMTHILVKLGAVNRAHMVALYLGGKGVVNKT